MSDAQLPQRQKSKGGKRRRKNVNTNLLQVVSQLKPANLQGLLLGTAVWVCTDAATVHMLDTLCLGNLDGGEATALYVREVLEEAGAPSPAAAEQQQQQQPQPEAVAAQSEPAAQQAAGCGGGEGQPPIEEHQMPQQQERQPPQPGGGALKAVRLSLEEAFFMAYALRVLAVHERCSGPGEPPVAAALDDEALWQRLQRARPDFLLLYLAYHHFRSKGWIPRTGLQYGADMVLYQRHPALAHSDYSVLVLPRDARWRPAPSWHEIQVLNRLSGQVSKKLLLLYVQEEGGGSSSGSSDYTSPRCLARFSVQERLVRRWVPDSHRPA